MLNWLKNKLKNASRLASGNADAIPDVMWASTMQQFPFLARRPIAEQSRLRSMTAQFLGQKQFRGEHALQVTD